MGLLVPNFRGEVWLQPGQPASQGAVYRRKREQGPGEGGVALVLGTFLWQCIFNMRNI